MTVLGPEIPKFPIGVSDYAKLRRNGFTYIDKTALVADVLDRPGETKLIPRPRRFGKTLNMSMLRYFFERDDEDRADLFEDTWIWTAECGRFREHFQRYPVIWLTFKDIKGRSWEESWADIRALLRGELSRLRSRYDLTRVVEAAGESADWINAADRPDATPSDLKALLGRLSSWLFQATGERVVVLIDEYDAALHAAWEHGYWDDGIAFFRDFLSGGLKDATHLHRGVLTGILKVAKENIFSGLNNVDTYSLFNPYISTRFGFTSSETAALTRAAGLADHLDTLTEWYNGYLFGGREPETMYNPWSILQYLSKPEAGALPYWKNSSSNALVRELLVRQASAAGPDVASLLNSESVAKTIDENVVLTDLGDTEDALWGLLTFSGYLTAERAVPTAAGHDVHLRIPNREVEAIFRSTFSDLLHRGGEASVVELTRAMLAGDARTFERRLSTILVTVASYHDFGGRAVEAVYQALVLGLLVHLEPTHRVRSNREAGYGRVDVLIAPRRPGPGAVLELKVVEPEFGDTVDDALNEAVSQLVDRDYAAELRADGATEVHQYGIVFDGKRCWVRVVEE